MSSVGELVMVVIHSMAHIAVGQMEDDSDPYFLRAFYKVSAPLIIAFWGQKWHFVDMMMNQNLLVWLIVRLFCFF